MRQARRGGAGGVAAAVRAESTPVLKEKSVSPTPSGTGTHFLLCGGGGVVEVDILRFFHVIVYKNTIFLPGSAFM